MGKWDEAIEAGSGDMWDGTGVVEGEYIAKRTDVGPNNSNVYLIRTKDGDIGVWGSTVLDGKFDDIPLKSEVQVEFLGLSEKKGKFGKPYKEYRVRFIPPSNVQAATTTEAPQEGERIAIDKEVKAAPANEAEEAVEELGLGEDY